MDYFSNVKYFSNDTTGHRLGKRTTFPIWRYMVGMNRTHILLYGSTIPFVTRWMGIEHILCPSELAFITSGY